jgi:cellulose synthase (UDP-forming)
LRVFVSSVGWVPARVARTSSSLVGIRFEHEGLIERDLLIRKLFTSGLTTVVERAGLADVTLRLLERIWTADMRLRSGRPAEDVAGPPAPEAPAPAPAPARLPAASLVLEPSEHSRRLIEAAERLERAA